MLEVAQVLYEYRYHGLAKIILNNKCPFSFQILNFAVLSFVENDNRLTHIFYRNKWAQRNFGQESSGKYKSENFLKNQN